MPFLDGRTSRPSFPFWWFRPICLIRDRIEWCEVYLGYMYVVNCMIRGDGSKEVPWRLYSDTSATGSADADLLVVVIFPLNRFRISSYISHNAITHPPISFLSVALTTLKGRRDFCTHQPLLAITKSRHQMHTLIWQILRVFEAVLWGPVLAQNAVGAEDTSDEVVTDGLALRDGHVVDLTAEVDSCCAMAEAEKRDRHR